MTRAPHFPPGALLTVAAAARRLHVSTSAIALAVRDGRLAARVVDGVCFVEAAAIEQLHGEQQATRARVDAAFRRT